MQDRKRTLKKARPAQQRGNWKSGGGPRGKNDLPAVYAVVGFDGLRIEGFLRCDGAGWAVYEDVMGCGKRLSPYFLTFAAAKAAITSECERTADIGNALVAFATFAQETV